MNVSELGFKELNRKIRGTDGEITLDGCCGQRFICSGMRNKTITINGTPGNALGAYFDGGTITVNGNAQDAVGDTMNDGKIVIHGSAGDALGYSMRGGVIFVRGDAGYRTGIHMKEYRDKKPVIVVGGSVGSFLGEYLAGGLIIVLGIGAKAAPVGNFTGTGMHGGKIFVRTECEMPLLPAQVIIEDAEDLSEISAYVHEFGELFGMDAKELLSGSFRLLKPNAKNPYKQLYTDN